MCTYNSSHTTFFHIFSFQYQIWCVCVSQKLGTGSPYGVCFLRAGKLMYHTYIVMDTWELGQADFDILSDRASETLDPMTTLRSDVLYVFLESWLVL